MNLDFLDRRRAERFAELLDENPGSPPRRHTRGPADEQLAELVAIGHSLSVAKSGPRVDPEFRVGLRAMLVATAERDGIGSTADVETEPEPARRRVFAALGSRRIRTRGAIVLGVAAGALAVSGISAASENASPGDALYGVKRSTERAQLAMAGSDVSRGQLSLGFAEKRLGEAAALPTGDPGFASTLDDMDADTRKGVKLLTTSAVAHKDKKPLDSIDTFVKVQRKTLLPALGKLAPADRERAAASLNLIDQVSQRSAILRDGLSCTPFTPDGTSDSLGPKLTPCRHDQNGTTSGVANGAGTTTPKPGHTTAKPTVKPGKTAQVAPRPGVSVAPKVSSGVVVPGSSGPALAPTDATPDLTPTPGGDPPIDPDDPGVLGGLLGGIIGGGQQP